MTRPTKSLAYGATLLAAMLWAPMPATATFGTSGQAYASAAGVPPVDSSLTDPVFVGDSIAVANGYGAQASAIYWASLASAALSSLAAATADPANVIQNSAGAEVNAVSFVDRLFFTIPAGTYGDGLFVRFHGFTQGSLLALGCTNNAGNNLCSNGYHTLRFDAGTAYGSATYAARKDVDAGGVAAASMDTLFALDVPILNATTLAVPLTVAAPVSASIITKGIALGTYGYPAGAVLTMFSGDVWGAFTSIDVPADVTWTSESGVFLSQPVPEPATWLLWLAGGVVVSRVRWRRTRNGT
ncbi:MAG: PEP-CTERM sorting domain-containing protein [Rubrivivax sp.]|nr:PEP-CTERM sorting domain-containing protein [Rubrivivax sp.]